MKGALVNTTAIRKLAQDHLLTPLRADDFKRTFSLVHRSAIQSIPKMK